MAQASNDVTANDLGAVKPVMRQSVAIALPAATVARFATVATLRTYLLTQGYTNAQLDVMNLNDLHYAARRKSGI